MTLTSKQSLVESRVYREVASALKRNGIPYLFGMPGGGSSIDLIEACRDEGIPFVLAQHETSAALMAVVCGELTGTCGASISIMGPGAINLAAGAVYAHLERHPLLCISEFYGAEQARLTSIQNIDHARTFDPYCKDTITLDSKSAGRQIDDAVRLATKERPGPIQIDLPQSFEPRPDDGALNAVHRVDRDASSAITGDFAGFARAIDRADKPVIIAGPVVLRQHAEQQLVRLAEKLHAALMVTPKARGVVSEDHPLYAGAIQGVYQQETLEGRIVHRSDLILAVGLDRVELLGPWKHQQPLLALDAVDVGDETVGSPALTATGPLPELLGSVADAVRQRVTWPVEEISGFWDEAMGELGAGNAEMNATSVLVRARQIAPRDAILTTEAGIYGRVDLYAWKVYGPGTYFDSNGASTMGFSLPAGLATSLMRPAQKTVTLVGDGGFLMRAGELETAARLKVAPVIVIFDDGTLGMIRVKQRDKEYARQGVDMAQTDFVRLAEGFGGVGWEVHTLAEFETAFGTAMESDRLHVIDVRVDADVYASHLKPIRGI